LIVLTTSVISAVCSVKPVKGKKSVGMKQRIREEREKEKRIAYVVAAAILITVIGVSSFLVVSMLNQPSNNNNANPTSQHKAAIVDHLSLTAPNQTFVNTATHILEQAGYNVTYYSGEEVTVSFYKDLPSLGYELIVLRVHSTAANPDRPETAPVTLFTSERYTQSNYIGEQLSDQLVIVTYSDEDYAKGITYFGINPEFVTNAAGRFQNTTIIMMGCGGLDNPSMAAAFVQKGSKVYISWDGPVTAEHSDQATIDLLHKLTLEKQVIRVAVEGTMNEVQPDPIFRSVLAYYPLIQGSQTIKTPTENP